MNRKRLWMAPVLVILLVVLLAVTAAADSPLSFKGSLDNYKFTGPATVTVAITVSNAGDGDLPGPVTLYYPSGKQVEEFGSPTLTAGGSKSWAGPWTVTQKELDEGVIAFTVRYSVYDDEGVLQNKASRIKFTIQYSGAEPELSVKRTFLPAEAQKGQEVSVIYEITNSGSADVSDVVIKENSTISEKEGKIESIPAGETGKYIFTAKMGTKDLTSAATISYKAGGKSYSMKADADIIKYTKLDLRATLTADKKGGAPGDTVKLTLKLVNSGKEDFTNISVTDATLGDVFSGETVRAGETVNLEKDLTVTESTDLQFVVNADKPDGKTIQTATGRISVVATDPTKQIVLSVEAAADRSEVYKIPGGVVRFTITVHNESTVDVANISVKAVDKEVYQFDSIPAGESRSVTRDMEISMAGSFQFTANAKDELGQTVTFPSNAIQINYAPPTPVPTEAPLVTPPAPATEPLPQATKAPQWIGQTEQIAETAKWILAGVAGVLAVLLLIGAVRRGRSRSQSNKAMDHLEGANYRDYSVAPRRRRRNEVISGEEEKKGAEAPAAAEQPENTAQSSELMAETLKRLYNEGAEKTAETAEAVETVTETATEAAEETAETAAEPEEQTVREASRRRRAEK